MKTGVEIGDSCVRAPNSMYLAQWLDQQGFDYDVFSDDDFDSGVISAADYRVLMPHLHHEYWSAGMLQTMTSFLDDGGTVVAPAGNIFIWQVVYDAQRIMEIRKFGKVPIFGYAAMQSGIDRSYIGTLAISALCNGDDSYHGGPRFRALAVAPHLVMPRRNNPFCFGQWGANNTDHWLWRGSGLINDEPDDAGTILYFPHRSGGHVLVIGASATPWALASDTTLSGLLRRSLACFAYEVGCDNQTLLPFVAR